MHIIVRYHILDLLMLVFLTTMRLIDFYYFYFYRIRNITNDKVHVYLDQGMFVHILSTHLFTQCIHVFMIVMTEC